MNQALKEHLFTTIGILMFCSLFLLPPAVYRAIPLPDAQSITKTVAAIVPNQVIPQTYSAIEMVAPETKQQAASQYLTQAVENSADNLAQEVPKAFWLTASSHDFASQAAIDAGGIVEYEPRYYASHNYDEGQIFYQFEIGDIVHIDDVTIRIEGIEFFNYNTDTLSDIRGTIGYNTVAFQTCTGDGKDGIVLYYGVDPKNPDAYYSVNIF